jgi:uncharacterized protein (DUF58 family)
VDWKATARLQRPITREYGQESNQNILFLLDSGRMMAGPMDGLTAFDHALNASLLLGIDALRRGDRVGLLAFDDRVRTWVSPRSGRRRGNQLTRATFDLHPTRAEPNYPAAFRHLVTHVRRRSLVVVFVAVVDDANAAALERLVSGLAKRHLPLVVWLADPAIHALSTEGDVFDRAAAAELLLHRHERLTARRRLGAQVVDVPVDQLTSVLLARYVEIKARRML